MLGEGPSLAGAVLSGLYLVLAVAERLSARITTYHLTPLAAYCSLWNLVFVAPVFLLLRSSYLYQRGMRRNGCLPAAVFPHRDPVLGWDFVSGSGKAMKAFRILQYWDDLFRDLGQTYWVNTFGSWMLMTNEPDNVKEVLATQFDTWELSVPRQRSSQLVLGPHAIFSVNGREWQRSRALIRPTFVRNQLADLQCTDRHVENLLEKLPRDGSKFDLQELLHMFTMDVSTDFMFGHSSNALRTPTKRSIDFMKDFDYALFSSSTRARLGWATLFFPDKRQKTAVAACNSFIDGYMAEALAKNKTDERSYVFMHELLKSGAPLEHVRGELLAMILGGRDTSASTLSSLFWMLSRRPAVVAKLRDEVARLEGRRPTWEECKDLKYLNMVLKEALRLWAPVPSNSRVAIKDTVLPRGGGPDGQSPLFVRKGTTCRFTLHSLHRRREFFGPDADEFRPERWETLRSSWEYLPFSGGPRICVGQQFALTQMTYLLTRVLQVFKTIKAEDDMPMEQELSTTLGLVNGLWLSLVPA